MSIIQVADKNNMHCRVQYVCGETELNARSLKDAKISKEF
jgi:hypothetical protein